jgi:hypothetical protein
MQVVMQPWSQNVIVLQLHLYAIDIDYLIIKPNVQLKAALIIHSCTESCHVE